MSSPGAPLPEKVIKWFVALHGKKIAFWKMTPCVQYTRRCEKCLIQSSLKGDCKQPNLFSAPTLFNDLSLCLWYCWFPHSIFQLACLQAAFSSLPSVFKLFSSILIAQSKFIVYWENFCQTGWPLNTPSCSLQDFVLVHSLRSDIGIEETRRQGSNDMSRSWATTRDVWPVTSRKCRVPWIN